MHPNRLVFRQGVVHPACQVARQDGLYVCLPPVFLHSRHAEIASSAGFLVHFCWMRAGPFWSLVHTKQNREASHATGPRAFRAARWPRLSGSERFRTVPNGFFQGQEQFVQGLCNFNRWEEFGRFICLFPRRRTPGKSHYLGICKQWDCFVSKNAKWSCVRWLNLPTPHPESCRKSPFALAFVTLRFPTGAIYRYIRYDFLSHTSDLNLPSPKQGR